MKTKVIYINRRGQGYLETIDEFPFNNRDERNYAREMLSEYCMSDPAGNYYFSIRCCKGWNNYK